MAKKRSQKKTSRRPSASPANRVVLTEAEKQVALSQLGISQSELEGKPATWPYLVGGLMILGALVLSGRLVTR